MNNIKVGDFVARKSHKKDLVFKVIRKIKLSNKKEIAILRGITVRVEADAPIEDLCLIESKEIKKIIKTLDNNILEKIKKDKIILDKQNKRKKELINTGKILHLDGDKKYSDKAIRYYKKMGLNAVVKNISESKQPQVIYNLLNYYNPDILVITGHDGMIKKETRFNDIYNYRNSKYFIETVKQARKYEKDYKKNIAIFAGACQSYYEALILAGANFASSPARILIDFLDPLIVAKNIAMTDKEKYVTIDDIVEELRDGKKGVNGIGVNGKKTIIII